MIDYRFIEDISSQRQGKAECGQSPSPGDVGRCEPPRMSHWVDALRARRRLLADADDAAKVDLLIGHLIAEGEGDISRTMATIADDGVYRSWGGTRGYTATKAGQQRIYEAVYARNPDAYNLRLDIERLFVGRDGVCMDGVLEKEVTGDVLVDMGFPLPEGATPSDRFVLFRRQALFVSYVDGLMRGEDIYWDEGGTVVCLVDGPVGGHTAADHSAGTTGEDDDGA